MIFYCFGHAKSACKMHPLLYINFPKKGVAQTFLRGHSNAGFAGVWAGRELTFRRHLFSENWKVKIEEEKGWKKECENAFCKIRNWKCKMPCEKKRIRRERWTITISLNIDFFFSYTIFISIFHKRKTGIWHVEIDKKICEK